MPLDLKDLERSIEGYDAIAKEGADRDGALVTLSKGMADGFRGLVDLLKAMAPKPGAPKPGAPEPDGDEGAGGAGDGDGDETPKDDDDDGDDNATEPDGDEPPGPGFVDNTMTKGANGEEFVDITEHFLALEPRLVKQAKEIKALRKAVADGNKELTEIKGLLHGFVRAYADTQQPLAKAVMDVRGALADLPGAVHNPGLDARRVVVRHAIDVAAKAEEAGVTPVKLSKALRDRVISEDQFREFKRTGAFSSEEATNVAILEKVKAL